MTRGRVVAACDGHAPGVVETAVTCARLLDADVMAATAYRYEPVSLGSAAVPRADNEARLAAADRVVDHAAGHAPDDVRVRSRVIPADDIAGALVDLAAEVGAALLVLGSDHRGHVTADVVRRAPCPVVVAPADPLLAIAPPDGVAAAFDGSPSSRMAVVAAARLGLLAAAPLTVLAVAGDADGARALERDAIGVTDIEGQEVRLEVLTGDDPARELRRAAERFDLLVCGSRGRGRLTSALLGSTSTALAADPPCPLMIVPHQLRRDARRPLGVGKPPTLAAEVTSS